VRCLGLGGDEVGDCFGLGEVETSVQKRPLGEFSWVCHPYPGVDEEFEDGADDEGGAVAENLGRVLACERVGCAVNRNEDFIYGFARCRVGDGSEQHLMAFGGGYGSASLEERAEERNGILSGNSYDGNGAGTGGGCLRADGIVKGRSYHNGCKIMQSGKYRLTLRHILLEMIDFNRHTLVLLLSSLFVLFSCEKQDRIWSSNRYLISYEVRDLTVEDVKNYISEHYYVYFGVDSLVEQKLMAEIGQEITLYTITYRTPATNFGSETSCSGIVTVPKGRTPKRQILSFHQNWTANRDFPSEAGFSLESFLSFGDNIVITPDFMGYGASVNHPFPYMHLKQNFRTNVDMLFAAWELFDKIGMSVDLPLSVIGYSQGGYEALGFQYIAERDYSDRINITQVICGGIPINLNRIMESMIRADRIEAEVPPIMILLGMDAAMNLEVDFNNVFCGELATKYPEWVLSKQYNKRQIETSLAADRCPSKFLHPDFFNGKGNSDIRKLTEHFPEVSIPSDWVPQAPLIIVHGTKDSVCYIESVLPDLENLKKNGKDVRVHYVEGGTHVGTYLDFALDALSYFL